MSDPNKFINTYIDIMMATLHEQLGSSLQLKTQLKLANDLLVERDATIAQLNAEVDNLKTNYSVHQESGEVAKAELSSCQDKLRIAEESHAAIKNKLTHMDSLLSQLSEMKREVHLRDETISNKDIQIAELLAKIKQLENPPPPVKIPEATPTVVKAPIQSSSNTLNVKLNTKTIANKTKRADDDF